MYHTNPETELEIDAIARVLIELPIRQVATYDALSEAVGYDVRAKRFALMKARNRVEAQTGLRFSTVHGEGVKKLDAAAVAGIGADARKAIARKAKTQSARLTGLRYNDIDPKAQQRIDVERSLLGAISAAAKTPVERIEGAVSTGPVVASKVFDLLNRAA